ncbi:MAG: hypothetical protein IKZ82_13945 [Clostridia bacterium]|nr:hypothetical protein [Clostridia bacterium]
MNIEYPTEAEIALQKKRVIEGAFKKTVERPPLRVVFHNSAPTVAISLLVYLFLVAICSLSGFERVRGGFLALAVFPLTYFAFFFISLLSEEQSELIELKRSMKYSYGYLVGLRMFYASLAAVPANLAVLVLFFGMLDGLWSIGAAGVTASLLLALMSLVSYEKTRSLIPSAVMTAVWTLGCVVLMKHGAPLYELLINAVPLAVHIIAASASLSAFIAYIGKVEKQNAYGF